MQEDALTKNGGLHAVQPATISHVLHGGMQVMPGIHAPATSFMNPKAQLIQAVALMQVKQSGMHVIHELESVFQNWFDAVQQVLPHNTHV